MSNTPSTPDRLDELMATAVTDGLSDAENRELDALLAAELPGEPRAAALESWELAAGALHRAVAACDSTAVSEVEPVPVQLKAQLYADAQATFAHLHTPPPSVESRTASPNAILPWLLMAASMVFAFVVWWEPIDATPDQRRIDLIARAPDTKKVEWTGLTPDMREIQGDITWSAAEQEGYLRISGIPTNNPAEKRYQLWIVDAGRGDSAPVDGGLFDITSEIATAVIPMDPALQILEAQTFAITLEDAPGVVVSAGPLLAAATIK